MTKNSKYQQNDYMMVNLQTAFIISNHYNSPINIITSHFTDEEIGAQKCLSGTLRATWYTRGQSWQVYWEWALQVDLEP